MPVLIVTSVLVACAGAGRLRSTGTITRSQRGTPAHVTAPATPAEVERTPTSEPAVASAGTWWAPFEHAPATDSFDGAVSYYADSLAGNSTASGEPYDPHELTAASRTLPFGTVLRVTRPDTGRSVIVRVNDRGPFGRRTRVLDLSRSAAEALDMIRRGVADVHVEVVGHID